VLSEHLRHLLIQNIWFPCVPSFIDPTLLPNLCYLELDVGHMDEAGLRALGGLPDLHYLCIRLADSGTASHKHAAVVNIVAHDVFFPKLRSLRLYGWMVQLATNGDSTSASLSIWRGGQDAAMVWYLIPKQRTGLQKQSSTGPCCCDAKPPRPLVHCPSQGFLQGWTRYL